ncbi:penicillin acylase family protein [Govanella unica]|uniref:Penicillin acylase family protein n=1 Tax=Govanella unica TaxID=2975056 RepID=A0A9X3TZE1_9PROT|nr:penicillin acylase family protein [Govania unica]MDA5194530.1 penicillin acylase family protein [Govania unica]
MGRGIVFLATIVWGQAEATDIPGSARVVERSTQGLEQPAEILIDYWGIAHIYAGTVHDAFFLQGYNAARDRLWQIDLWRKRGLGLLSRDFGPDYIAQDRAARLFLYRGDMAREWAAYGPDAKSQTEAFVAGVNAFVGEIRNGARPLPVEFTTASSMPDLWSPEDILRIRSHGLTRNLTSEVARAHVACKAGLQADRLRRKLEPDWTTKIPAGLDPCQIPKEVLTDYRLGTDGVTLGKPSTKTALDDEPFAEEPITAAGSNAWIIGPERTTTGRPILASDPHRAVTVPSLRYIVHMNAPGFSVIGAGEPFLPGVSIGHNDTIAFGLTISAIDQEDLYVYDLNPANAGQYRYQGQWEDVTIIKEPIPVKGQPDAIVELRFTRHGPVLYQDPAGARLFALRGLWSEPGAAAYFASSRYMTAHDWDAFKAAVAEWRTPSENLLYADKNGNIGWVVAAGAPLRPNWDGLLPVPGDGRYEWNGLAPADRLPQSYNPRAGWFASANEMNLPADYPLRDMKPGFEWAEASRATRLKDVLGSAAKTSLADSMALQMDDYSVMARRLTKLLAPLISDDPVIHNGLALLKSWNLHIERDSAAAALFEVWSIGYLGKATVAKVSPAVEPIIKSGAIDAVVSYLEKPDRALGRDPARARDALLLSTLKEAMTDLQTRLGPDHATWRWGQLHHAQFDHVLSPTADSALRAQLNVGPMQKSGGTTTVNLSPYDISDFRQVHGASFRMVLDVGEWDNSVTINTPGQSGNPFDPHYRDLFPLWLNGQYVPLLYSRAAVARSTQTLIKFTPGHPKP